MISGPTIGPEGSLESEISPARRKLLTIVPELVRPVHPLKDFIALRKLEKILREQKPDIVHTHSGKAGILGRLAAKRAGVPVIIHHIHGPSFGNFQGALANFIFTAAEKRAAQVTDHFFCLADAMTKLYLAAGIGKPENVHEHLQRLSPRTISQRNKRSGASRRKLGLAPDDFVIGKIARLFKLKGHDDLFAVAPELSAKIRKSNSCSSATANGAARLKISQVRSASKAISFSPASFRPAKLPRYVGIMDCLAHLSCREGLPRALPQALAAGKPVVAYDFDGADESVSKMKPDF